MSSVAATSGTGRRSRSKRAAAPMLPAISPEPAPRAAMHHAGGTRAKPRSLRACVGGCGGVCLSVGCVCRRRSQETVALVGAGVAPPAGDSSAFLASFFEAQLAQAANEKEAAMTFAEEQLTRLNAQLVAAQRECGRLKARNENLEEEHEEVTREQAKMAKLLAIEKTRRKNMAAHMETVEKERKAFYRHAADTERHTLNQGRRWEEREGGLREEMERMRQRNEELAAAAENAEGLDLALRRSRVEQEAMIAATVGHKKANKVYAERIKALETELRHERALRIDIEHSRDQGARQREKLESEAAELKAQLEQAMEKQQVLKSEIPGKIKMALEDETEHKQRALKQANRAMRDQRVAELRLQELQDAALSAARPYFQKPNNLGQVFKRLLDEVVDMGGSLSNPDEVDFVDVEDHALDCNAAFANGRKGANDSGRKNEGAIGLPLVRQSLHASDESGTGSLDRNEFSAFYVHLGYFNELWGRFTALRATLTTGDAEEVYMNWDDFLRCCASVGFRVQEVQSRRDEHGELRSVQDNSPKPGAIQLPTAAGEDSKLTEQQLHGAFKMLAENSVDAPVNVDGADDGDAAELVAFKDFLSWVARRHAGQQALSECRGRSTETNEMSPTSTVQPGDGLPTDVDATESDKEIEEAEAGVTQLFMAAVKSCFDTVATAAAKAHGFDSVEAMAEAARAELGAHSDTSDDVAVNRLELTKMLLQDETLSRLLQLAETLNTKTHKLVVCHLPKVLAYVANYFHERGLDSQDSHVTWPDFSALLKERLEDAALGLRPVMSLPTQAAADALYDRIDHNGNGGLSLDEIDTHIELLGR